jgi:hypothetical protein
VAYVNLASVYVGMGKPDKARDILLKLLEIHPENKGAQQALKELRR